MGIRAITLNMTGDGHMQLTPNGYLPTDSKDGRTAILTIE